MCGLLHPPQVNLFYFNQVFQIFHLDSDGDRRLDIKQLRKGQVLLDLELTDDVVTIEFDAMDADRSGKVLFEEFAVWWGHFDQQYPPLRCGGATLTSNVPLCGVVGPL